MNRISALWLGGVLAFGSPAWAQVTVGLSLSQDQFLPGEALPVSVRITNFSGQILPLGRDNEWLQFTIEATTGYPVARISAPPVQGDFDLTNATVATKHLDLAPHFEILRPGRYLLCAYVRLPDRELAPLSARHLFDVISGTVLWEQAFGVVTQPEENRRPEVRRYALQQAIHLKQMKLYARVTDQTGERVFKVFPLGPMLTFSEPEHQIDQQSRLHVLYQFGARSFYYYILDPTGSILLRQVHDYTGASRPRLRADEDGKIIVRGGVRRPSSEDIPPADAEARDAADKARPSTQAPEKPTPPT